MGRILLLDHFSLKADGLCDTADRMSHPDMTAFRSSSQEIVDDSSEDQVKEAEKAVYTQVSLSSLSVCAS